MVIPSSTDVVIAGGGPVGLTSALLLDRAGVKVTVVERDAAPVEQSRAIWVHSRTLEIWDAIGMTRLACAEGRAVNGIEMHHRGHARAQLPYDGTGVSPHPNGLMLEQSRTQALLLSLVADTSIAFAWETEVASVSQRDGVCDVGVVDARGNRTTITAAFVVGADGGSSTVRKLAGITLEGGTYDSTFFLVDAMGATTLNPSHSHLNVNGRSTIAVLPLPGDGHFRIIGNMVSDDRDNAPDGGYGRTLTEDEVRQLVATNALPMSIESIGWSSTYRSHHRVANTFRRGRILLAGDAGHLHSPAGGLGMNTGIADAADLAWRVAGVLAGAPDTLLDDYSSERREAARGVIRTSDRLFTLQANTHAGIAFVRRNLLPLAARMLTKTHVGRSLAFRALSGTYVSYGSGRGRRGGGALRVGHLLHLSGIPALDHAVRNPSPRHLIIRMRPGKPSFDSAPADLAARRGWEFISVDGPAASRVVGTRSPEVIVWVRPDRYVGWIGTDLEELGTILDAQIGPATRHRKTPDAD